MLEVSIRTEQHVTVTDRELREQRVDRAQLDARGAAAVAQSGSLDVVVTERLDEWNALETPQDLGAGFETVTSYANARKRRGVRGGRRTA